MLFYSQILVAKQITLRYPVIPICHYVDIMRSVLSARCSCHCYVAMRYATYGSAKTLRYYGRSLASYGAFSGGPHYCVLTRTSLRLESQLTKIVL